MRSNIDIENVCLTKTTIARGLPRRHDFFSFCSRTYMVLVSSVVRMVRSPRTKLTLSGLYYRVHARILR